VTAAEYRGGLTSTVRPATAAEVNALVPALHPRAIAYISWSKAAEAPVLHHQLAKAQRALESAEMCCARLNRIYCEARESPPSMKQRVQARAWIGHVATLARECVNHLFEARFLAGLEPDARVL
jgi:hypothetical protein